MPRFWVVAVLMILGVWAQVVHSSDQATLEDMALPTPCEVCAVVAREFTEGLELKTARGEHYLSAEGRRLNDKGDWVKTSNAEKSELPLIELLDDVCETIQRNYSVEHRDADGNFDNRIPGQIVRGRVDLSQGMRSQLKNFAAFGLNLGDQLEGIEKQMEDPLGEMKRLRIICDDFVGDMEDMITKWYWSSQARSLREVLCEEFISADCVYAGWDEERRIRALEIEQENRDLLQKDEETTKAKPESQAKKDKIYSHDYTEEELKGHSTPKEDDDFFTRLFRDESIRQERIARDNPEANQAPKLRKVDPKEARRRRPLPKAEL